MIRYLLLLLLPLTLFGQSQKISDMTSATTLAGTEYVPIVQTTNKKATVSLLRGFSSYGTAGQYMTVNGSANGVTFVTPPFISSVGTGVANELTYWSGTSTLGSLATATYPSLIELSYVKGVTSAVQTQMDTKWGLSGTSSITGSTVINDPTQTYNLNIGGGMGNNPQGIYITANSTAYIGRQALNYLEFSSSGTKLLLGSDATGDMYYRNSSGYLTRLAAGTNGHVLTLSGGIPSWAAPSSGWALTGTSTFTGAVNIAGSTTNTLTHTFDALGTTATNVFNLVNTTAAAAGAQQISPPFLRRGNGWKTNATAASQTVDFIDYVTPVQGAAAPTGYWSMYSSINGGANSENFRIRSDGALFLTGGSGFSANLYFSTDGLSSLSRGTSGTQQLYIYGPSSTANNYTVGVSSYSSNNYNYTSGTGGSIQLPGNFNPSSGSGVFNGINATGTINMTGTSSGNVVVYNNSQTVTAAKGNYTGFYYGPSVTSITGTELSFHATRGKVLFGGTTISSNTYFDFRGGSSTDKILRLADGSNNELFTFKANKEYEVTQTNGKYQERQSTGTIAATSFSETIYASTDISDGQSVTIEVLWTAKDSGANTGAGGIFYTTWTKASGTLAKAGDNQLVTNDNMTGSWAVSTRRKMACRSHSNSQSKNTRADRLHSNGFQ